MEVKALTRNLLVSSLLTLLLISCATQAPAPKRHQFLDDPQVIQADQAYRQGDYARAALLYSDATGRAPAVLKPHFMLLTADSHLLAGNPVDSRLMVALIDDTGLQDNDAFRYRLIESGLLLSEKKPTDALELLSTQPAEDTPAELKQRYHRNKARAYLMTGDGAERIRQLQTLDSLLLEREPKLANQLEILRNLVAAGDLTLSALQPPSGEVEAGWLALASLINSYQQDPMGIIQPYNDWRLRYFGHPVLPELLENYYRYRESLFLEVNTLAILLPRSGAYSRAAEAIRNGIMAAWYAQPVSERPEIRFYDSTDTDKVWPLVSQAIEEGADAIIGPLNKAAVLQLARSGEIPGPVLVLNQVITDLTPPENLYQYSLSPEDEARQVAEMAWQEGLSYPVILYPPNNWGERMVQAFSSRWTQLGGHPPSKQQYDPASHDFSVPVQTLLKLDESAARNQNLQRLLGKKLEFQPRRRADADFVFLVAKDRLARQIKPQLAFHYAGDLPILSTSHAWTGKLTHQQALDARGIRLPDIPWLVEQDDESPLSRQKHSELFPGTSGNYSRLYAMGIDSFRLLPHLRRMENSQLESVDGATGILYMDRNKHIHRQLVWITLDEVPLIQGYSPRMDPSDPAMLPTPAISTGGSNGEDTASPEEPARPLEPTP